MKPKFSKEIIEGISQVIPNEMNSDSRPYRVLVSGKEIDKASDFVHMFQKAGVDQSSYEVNFTFFSNGEKSFKQTFSINEEAYNKLELNKEYIVNLKPFEKSRTPIYMQDVEVSQQIINSQKPATNKASEKALNAEVDTNDELRKEVEQIRERNKLLNEKTKLEKEQESLEIQTKKKVNHR